MIVWKIIAVGMIGAILISYLKSTGSGLTGVATVGVGTVLLLLIVTEIDGVVNSVSEILNISNINSTMCGIIIKITGISYLIEFASDTIEDFGAKSVADKVVFGGKILILTMSFPIIKSLISRGMLIKFANYGDLLIYV